VIDAVSENEIWKAKIDLQIFQTLMLECDNMNYSELNSSKCMKHYIKIIQSSTSEDKIRKDENLASSVDGNAEESNDSIIEHFYLETTV
jgi:hypothetical protein